MPSYPFLFEVKDKAGPEDKVVNLPPGTGPAHGVVVATPQVQDLVAYLRSLDRTYPVAAGDDAFLCKSRGLEGLAGIVDELVQSILW